MSFNENVLKMINAENEVAEEIYHLLTEDRNDTTLTENGIGIIAFAENEATLYFPYKNPENLTTLRIVKSDGKFALFGFSGSAGMTLYGAYSYRKAEVKPEDLRDTVIGLATFA